jgi:hypothetical protein
VSSDEPGVAGLSAIAALGDESNSDVLVAKPDPEPVCVLVQPEGSPGALTASKYSANLTADGVAGASCACETAERQGSTDK